MAIKNVLFVVGDVKIIRLPIPPYPSEELLNASIQREAKKNGLRLIGIKKPSYLHDAVSVLATYQ